jgi:hypothetical protein
MDNQQVRPEILYKDFPLNGNYTVYSDGRIFVKRKNKFINGTDHQGYRRFKIIIDNELKSLLGHRIVAITFLPNPDNLAEVNHIDGNRANNNLSNLEWVSREGNQQHAFKTGLNSNKGSKNGRAQMNETTAREMYLHLLSGKTITELNKEYGYHKSALSKLKARVNWYEITQDLPDCPRQRMDKESFMTDEKRLKVLELKDIPLSTKEIAEILCITIGQVENAVTLYNKGKLQRPS